MTVQLELPLFDVRSTADNPVPERERTHPAQMIIRHCGKQRNHVSHAFHDDFPFGCPGTPDLRDTATMAADIRRALEQQQAVREMEIRTYDCGVKQAHHAPHERADGLHCAGLTVKRCDDQGTHTHHRWWSIPDAFYWCDGLPGAVCELLSPTAVIRTAPFPRGLSGRAVEDVELPNRDED